jgi:hypothetical protein
VGCAGLSRIDDRSVGAGYEPTGLLVMDRDFENQPYSDDERRVADYLIKLTDGQVGAGDDPIGFLIASHDFIVQERAECRVFMKGLQDTINFIARWVERGLFDKHHSPKEALDVIALYPGMPWKNGRWDVDHKPYASAFYTKFPRARGDAS